MAERREELIESLFGAESDEEASDEFRDPLPREVQVRNLSETSSAIEAGQSSAQEHPEPDQTAAGSNSRQAAERDGGPGSGVTGQRRLHAMAGAGHGPETEAEAPLATGFEAGAGEAAERGMGGSVEARGTSAGEGGGDVPWPEAGEGAEEAEGTGRGTGGGTSVPASGTADAQRLVFGSDSEEEDEGRPGARSGVEEEEEEAAAGTGAEEEAEKGTTEGAQERRTKNGDGTEPGVSSAPSADAVRAVFGDSDSDEEDRVEVDDGQDYKTQKRVLRVIVDEGEGEGEEEEELQRALEDADEVDTERDGVQQWGEEEEGEAGGGGALEEPKAEEEEEEQEAAGWRRERPKGPPLELKLPLAEPPATEDKMKFLLASNVLALEPEEFDPSTYQLQDAARVETVARWRKVYQPDGTFKVQSNARLVRWSDGTMHVFLGNEALAVQAVAMKRENMHLFLHHAGNGSRSGALQAQGRLLEKLLIRPPHTGSKIHKQLALGLHKQYKKQTKVKDIAVIGDPEKDQEEREKLKKREEKLFLREQQRAQQQLERATRNQAMSRGPSAWQNKAQQWRRSSQEEDGTGELHGEGDEDEKPRRPKSGQTVRKRGRDWDVEEEAEEEEEDLDGADEEEAEESEEDEPEAESSGAEEEEGESGDEVGMEQAQEEKEQRDNKEGQKSRGLGKEKHGESAEAQNGDEVPDRKHEEMEWEGDKEAQTKEDDSKKASGGRRRVLVDSDEE